MKYTRENITIQVLDVIQSVRGKSIKEPPLTLDMRVVEDLHLEHDTGDIVLLLQQRTAINPPKESWKDARTIHDIIELLLKHA